MTRFAVVDGAGLVVNVIELEPDAEWKKPDGTRLVELAGTSPVSIGWKATTASGSTFREPPPPPADPLADLRTRARRGDALAPGEVADAVRAGLAAGRL